jgi:hypothetical protein
MFRLSASGLVSDEGFEAWREIMARMFHIDRTHAAGGLPRGGMSAAVLGDVMVNAAFSMPGACLATPAASTPHRIIWCCSSIVRAASAAR